MRFDVYCANPPIDAVDPSGLWWERKDEYTIALLGWMDTDPGRATTDTLVGLGAA